MGLIDTGQAVDVYVEEDATDGDGSAVKRPGATPVEVVGRWQYTSVTEDTSEGETLGTFASFLCRSFPAQYAGRVDYDGRTWDVVGEPAVAGLSAATTHTTVRLRARAPRAVS